MSCSAHWHITTNNYLSKCITNPWFFLPRKNHTNVQIKNKLSLQQSLQHLNLQFSKNLKPLNFEEKIHAVRARGFVFISRRVAAAPFTPGFFNRSALAIAVSKLVLDHYTPPPAKPKPKPFTRWARGSSLENHNFSTLFFSLFFLKITRTRDYFGWPYPLNTHWISSVWACGFRLEEITTDEDNWNLIRGLQKLILLPAVILEHIFIDAQKNFVAYRKN